MAYADAAALPRGPKLGFKIEVKRTPPTPPDPEDRRPWWRQAWEAVRDLVKVDVR